MFFMLSVPSPAARTSWRNMYAIASAPSAIRATMMTSTRLPPERVTTAGMIPVMGFLLGMTFADVRRGWCHAPPGSCQTGRARTTSGRRAHVPSPVVRRGARSAGGEGLFGGVVDDEDLRQAGDPEDLQQAVLVADQLQRALVGAHLLQAADQHTE